MNIDLLLLLHMCVIQFWILSETNKGHNFVNQLALTM